MRRTSGYGAVIACAVGLAGCGSPHTEVSGEHGHFTLTNGKVVLTAAAGSHAEISGDGGFAIDGKAIATSDAERATLARYHAEAVAFMDHARDTGKAGAAVGAAAVEGVVKGLASGDTSGIGKQIEGKADAVKAAAAQLCADLKNLVGLQASLAAELAAFRPYAVILESDAGRCRDDLAKSSGAG